MLVSYGLIKTFSCTIQLDLYSNVCVT